MRVKAAFIAVLSVVALAVAAFAVATVPAKAATLKPPGSGLYVRNGVDSTDQPAISHTFINIDWNQIEPTRGQFDWSGIDSLLTSRVDGARLRIYAGSVSPDWVKTDAGTATVHTNNWGTVVTPKYWTDAFLNDYQAFMQAVAAKYDGNPKVLDVVASACTDAADAEPFIKGGPTAGSDLYAAGDNDTNEHKCMNTSLADQMAAFNQTRISIAGHLSWQIPVSGGIKSSWPEEQDILNQWKTSYGSKLVVQDNGVSPSKATCDQSNPTTANADEFWCWMKAAPQPKGGQFGCGSADPNCTQVQVLDTALKFDLCFMEHASWGELSDSQAATYNSELAANCANVSPPPTSASPTPTSPTPTPTGSPTPTGTVGGPPAVAAGPVTVSGSTAVIHCQVNPEGTDTKTFIKYEKGTAIDANATRVPASGNVDIGSGTSVVDQSFSVSGLAAGATYAYRCSATSSAGFNSDDSTFTT